MTILKISTTEDIAGLRLHSLGVDRSRPEAERALWLLSLRDQQERRRADSEALQALVTSATNALGALPAVVGERIDGIAAIAVELGLSIAREIVGNALDRGHVDPSEAVIRCLRECVHGNTGSDMIVYLHPEDLELVEQKLATVEDLRDQLGGVRLAADPRSGRAAVRVETEAGKLKYDPRDALARVSEEVRREVRT